MTPEEQHRRILELQAQGYMFKYASRLPYQPCRVMVLYRNVQIVEEEAPEWPAAVQAALDAVQVWRWLQQVGTS